MKVYTLSQLSDESLTRGLAAVLANERAATAAVLAHVAEFDARKLYLPVGYPSMYAYCVGHLHLSEDAAYKRIKAARAARRFPAIFEAVDEGRLHLSAVVLLGPHLTEHTADELLAASTHKTKAQIEQLLAHWFPRPDVPTWVETISTALSTPLTEQQAPGPVEILSSALPPTTPELGEQDPGPVHVPHMPPGVHDRPRVKPLGPQRFALQVTIDQETLDLLRYAQDLLSHQIPSGDLARVLGHVLQAAIPELEKTKFAATDQPRPSHRRAGPDSRAIPADVMRAVWKRDQGQCTFVSESGNRCRARKFIEFDHVQEFSRGGEATVSGIRLRCRAHNQYAAECTFGVDFMRHKRRAATETRSETNTGIMATLVSG